MCGPHDNPLSQAKALGRIRATNHLTTDHIADVNRETARLRANMMAMHLWSSEESDPKSLQMHFVAGGVFEADAVRTAGGWRFRELVARITWRTGAGMAALARMGRPED